MNPAGDGSAEEVRALLTALTEWTRRAMPGPPSGQGGPECEWCPLCQLASALRGEHPELTDRLTEMGAAVAGAVRALLDSAARATPGSWDGLIPSARPAAPSAPSAPPPSAPPPSAAPTSAAPTSAAPTSDSPRPRPRPRPRVERSPTDGPNSTGPG